MHAKAVIPVGKPFYRYCVIQILCVRSVNRKNIFAAQIQTSRDFFVGDFFPAARLRFRVDTAWEGLKQSVAADQRQNIAAGFPFARDDLGDFSLEPMLLVRILRDLRHDLIAVCRAAKGVLFDINILRQLAVIRNDKSKAFFLLECADHFFGRTLQNFDNDPLLGFRPKIRRQEFDLRRITVHRAAQIIRRDKNISALLSAQESKASRMLLDDSGDRFLRAVRSFLRYEEACAERAIRADTAVQMQGAFLMSPISVLLAAMMTCFSVFYVLICFFMLHSFISFPFFHKLRRRDSVFRLQQAMCLRFVRQKLSKIRMCDANQRTRAVRHRQRFQINAAVLGCHILDI